MKRNEKIFLGVVVVGHLYINHKINKTAKAFNGLVSAVRDWMDAEYQEQIDEAFTEIVDNYDQ